MTLYTPSSIFNSLTAEQIPAHVAQLKAHLASREADKAKGRHTSSNGKVINQLKREIAHLEAAS